MTQHILVTGGAGYIGSHCCLQLLEAGYNVVVLDNLSNSKTAALQRVEQLSQNKIDFIQGDIRDSLLLDKLFNDYSIDAVIHFAGLKAVGESVAKPMAYYDNNVVGSLRLFQSMAKAGVKTLVFSSSATVYGDPETVPIQEHFQLHTTNPYGTSKLQIEQILQDIAHADKEWKIAILRYFNPVGAHPSGLIGEDPNGIPNNLMPYIAQVAVGKLDKLSVFGDDYPTKDGTGVRDYIHVEDLARGHLAALSALEKQALIVCNLGTGQGYSVLDMVEAFELASNKSVPYQIVERRPGDIAECYADPQYAKDVLNWQAEKTLEQMCEDHWRWQANNPQGFN